MVSPAFFRKKGTSSERLREGMLKLKLSDSRCRSSGTFDARGQFRCGCSILRLCRND